SIHRGAEKQISDSASGFVPRYLQNDDNPIRREATNLYLCGLNRISNPGFRVLPPSSDRSAVSRTPPPCLYQAARTSASGFPAFLSMPLKTIRSPCIPPSSSNRSPRLVTQLWCQTLRAAS